MKLKVLKRTRSGSNILIPRPLAYIFGGTFEQPSFMDSGGGYGWRPPIWRLIHRFYKENWHRQGYKLRKFLEMPKLDKRAIAALKARPKPKSEAK